MRRKGHLLLILVSAVMAASLCGCGRKAAEQAAAGEENQEESVEAEEQAAEIEQEFEFYSDEEDVIYFNLPETVELYGQAYELTGDAAYETIGTRRVVQQVVDSDVENLAEIPDTVEYEAESGNSYTLNNEQVYVKEQDAQIRVLVTDTVVYEDQYGAPSIPGTKAITYYSKATGQEEEVEGTLKESYESTPGHWEGSLHIDGTFQAPSGNVTEYTLAGSENVKVLQSALTPEWDTYQSDVLKSLGLSPEYFRVLSASWNGEQYAQGGYVLRDAVFEGDAYVSSYTAVYEAYGDSIGYKTKVFYRADAEGLDAPEEDVTTVLKVKAVVRYRLVEG